MGSNKEIIFIVLVVVLFFQYTSLAGRLVSGDFEDKKELICFSIPFGWIILFFFKWIECFNKIK